VVDGGRTQLVHGTAIAVAGQAVLIRGPSGAGKSDLALRCLAVPPGPFAAVAPMLVADDQVVVQRASPAHSSALEVGAPPAIRGLIEVRGLGIVQMPAVDRARLVLVADIVEPVAIERMPAAGGTAEICGIALPHVRLVAREPSAPLKLLLALAAASRSTGLERAE
jgi:HPr kinase/phosphorylase